MADREKVIKALEICAVGTNSCEKCPLKDKCHGVSNAAMVAAIKLLKEQEPVKPNSPGTTYPKAWSCGVCGYLIIKAWVACPCCGRKVNWDD